jgi:hypothetical protein
MIRVFVGFALAALAFGAADAQQAKADCAMFKHSSDGRWFSTVDSKIGNPKSFVLLQAGKPIDRDMAVLGNNVSETIDRLCGGK